LAPSTPPGNIFTISDPFSIADITSVTLPQPAKYGIEYLLHTLEMFLSKWGDTTNWAPFNMAILAVISSNTVPAPIKIFSSSWYFLLNLFIALSAYLVENVSSIVFIPPSIIFSEISTALISSVPRTTATKPFSLILLKI